MSRWFGRRRDRADAAAGAEADGVAGEAADEDLPPGPYDSADTFPRLTRIDLGALLVPVLEHTALQVEVDTATRVPRSATVVAGPSRVTLSAFAAPRTAGIWEEVRGEIVEAARAAGGRGLDAQGTFGPEVVTAVPATLPDGRKAVRVQRHVGVDGRRWFLRATFSGPEVVAAAGIATPEGSTDPARLDVLERVVRDCVVVRGTQAKPPREALPLTLPEQAAPALDRGAAAAAGGDAAAGDTDPAAQDTDPARDAAAGGPA